MGHDHRISNVLIHVAFDGSDNTQELLENLLTPTESWVKLPLRQLTSHNTTTCLALQLSHAPVAPLPPTDVRTYRRAMSEQ